MTQPAAPLAIPAPPTPAAGAIARGPATTFVQRITASPTATAAPSAALAKPTFAGEAGAVLADIVVGAPTSFGIGVGYAKGAVTKPRLIAAAAAAGSLAIGLAPYYPKLAGVARRLEMSCINAAALIAGLEFGGALKGPSETRNVSKIAEVDAEL